MGAFVCKASNPQDSGSKIKCPIPSYQLFVNDSAKTPVAFFHRRQFGIVGEARPASLEIFEAGKEMVDLIVVTGAYMEKLRKDKALRGVR